MPKEYEVLERAFINGRLCEPGDVVTLEIDNPGGHLKLHQGKEDQQQKPGRKPKAAEQDDLPDA